MPCIKHVCTDCHMGMLGPLCEVVEPDVLMAQSFKEVKEVMAEFKKKYNLSKVGAQGFCWGGKYTVLLLGAHLWKVHSTLQPPLQGPLAHLLQDRHCHNHASAVMCESSSWRREAGSDVLSLRECRVVALQQGLMHCVQGLAMLMRGSCAMALC